MNQMCERSVVYPSFSKSFHEVALAICAHIRATLWADLFSERRPRTTLLLLATGHLIPGSTRLCLPLHATARRHWLALNH